MVDGISFLDREPPHRSGDAGSGAGMATVPRGETEDRRFGKGASGKMTV